MATNDPHAAAPEKEMSNFFDDLRNVWDRHGSFALWVIVIASFSFLAFQLYTSNRFNTREAAWSDLSNSTAPASFEQVAADHSNRAVQQLALLQAADMYLGETAGLEEGDDMTARLDQAEALYQRVADDATHDIYKINALEGLAVVAEGRRDIDEALTRNDAVIALSETLPGFESWAARANARKQLLPQLAQPVSFVEDNTASETSETTENTDTQAEPAADLLDDSLDLDPIAIPTE
ncbi:MAG: hypothetical protein AAF328_00575 [Planctomycetota bacterium]